MEYTLSCAEQQVRLRLEAERGGRVIRHAVLDDCDDSIVAALQGSGCICPVPALSGLDACDHDVLILDWRQREPGVAALAVQRINQVALVLVVDAEQRISEHLKLPECVEFSTVDDLRSTAFRWRLARLIKRFRVSSDSGISSYSAPHILSQLVDHLRDWVIIKDLEHRFVLVSDDFARTVGLPKSEIIGRNDLEIGTDAQAVLGNPQTGRTGFWAQDDAVVESGEPASEDNLEWRAFSEERRYKRTIRVPLCDAQGHVFALLVIARDRTDRVLAERNLASRNLMLQQVTEEKLNAERHRRLAEQAIAAKSKFLAAASHDLRQPLHALGLFLAVLEHRMPEGDNLDILRKIRHSSDSLNALFNSLLDISRLDAGVVEVTLQTFSIREMLISIRDEFVQLGEARSLTVTLEITDAVVRTDPVLFARILRNLLQNAITHTQQGTVAVRCREQMGQLILDVSDTGPGIPENQYEAIFSDYYQLDDNPGSSSGGLGLGLAIVRKMARLLQIGVQLESRVGHGSTFSVNVPLGDLNEAIQTRPPARYQSLTGNRILLLDDEPQVREALKLILDANGCLTLSAESPEQAIERLTAMSIEPDIMIIDYRLMNEQTGIAAIAQLREHFARPVPAVIVTGDTSSSILQAVKKTGCRLLHKPLDAEQLVRVIADVLNEERSSVH